jgi:hypothetical protein
VGGHQYPPGLGMDSYVENIKEMHGMINKENLVEEDPLKDDKAMEDLVAPPF